jgi:hypothetical protein
MKRSNIILMVISVVLLYGIIVFLCIKESQICDELVIMNDGTQMEVTKVSSYDDGMSYIRKCDGEEITVPTVTIKMIKHNKK